MNLEGGAKGLKAIMEQITLVLLVTTLKQNDVLQELEAKLF